LNQVIAAARAIKIAAVFMLEELDYSKENN